MKKISKKIIRRLLCSIGIVCIIAAVAKLSSSYNDGVIPASVNFSEDMPIIVLDAGHGGMDGGCSTADGISEKGINLNILLKVRDMLRVSGYDVQVTRDTDKSIHDKGIEGIANQKSSDMDNRLALLNKYPNS